MASKGTGMFTAQLGVLNVFSRGEMLLSKLKNRVERNKIHEYETRKKKEWTLEAQK